MSDGQAAAPAPQAAPSGPAPGDPGSRENPTQVAIPGARARSDSRAQAVARVSRANVTKMMDGLRSRQRGPDGRFVRTEATEQPPTDKPAQDIPQPDEQPTDAPKGEAEAATTDAQKPAEEAKKPAAHVELEKKLAQFTEREQRYRQGSVEANQKILDLTDEAEHWRNLFEGLRHTVRQVTGRDVDPIELERAEMRLQFKRAKRGDTQREEAEKAAQTSRMTNEIRERIESTAAAAIKAHPEMNPQTNPAARAWWQGWFKTASNRIEDLPDAVAAAALVLRGKQLAAQKQAEASAAPPVPEARPRPQSTIPQGSQTGAAKAAGNGRARLSDKAVHLHMVQYRASKGA